MTIKNGKEIMDVLVTGGAGYIGSHTVLALVESGFNPIVVDNFCNSKPEAIKRLAKLCGRDIQSYTLDVCDEAALDSVFKSHKFEAVIHFAGLKAVGESCELPLHYYANNVSGSIVLAQVMARNNVNKLIFSSSATVYGDPESVPINETAATGATNPYGASKLMVEDIYRDMCKPAGSSWKVCLLRYFNPVGAHVSGTIGEDPQGIPNNLLPFATQVAVGKRDKLSVFGDDYSTPDGTGVRDYIHVLDLAAGHVAALNYLCQKNSDCYTFNLGTGQGSSVLELVAALEKVSGRDVPYVVAPRRAGDIAECFADPLLAETELGWRAELPLERMVADAWRWQSNNPNGYQD